MNEEETPSVPPNFPPPMPPPLPPRSTKDRKASTSSQRDPTDITLVERSRREKMGEFYSILQSAIPNSFPKATRTRIVEEAVVYIRDLKQVIANMEEEKRRRISAQAQAGHNDGQRRPGASLSMIVHGEATFFGLRSVARPGIASRILQAFEHRNVEILSANVTTVGSCVNVAVTAASVEGKALDELKEDLSVLLS